MSDRILVTGGTGFTGSHLVRDLVEDGHRVRVVTRSFTKAKASLPPAVEVMVGDIADAAVVEAAVRDQDVVFHLATTFREPGIPDSRYREVHVDSTRLLLEAGRRQGLGRFVHCSTVGVLSHIENPPADESWPHAPGDIYQETKSEAEQLALAFQREHDFPLTVARPTPIYGPGDLRLLKMFRMIARRRFVMLGDGKVFYHMVYVTDLVAGLRLLASDPRAVGEVFILGGDEYLTLEDTARLIADAIGVPPPSLHLPALPFQLAGSLCERLFIPLGLEPPIYRRRVDFFTKSRAFSIDKAKRMLGYQPRVDLVTGIRNTANWYREQGLLTRPGRTGS
jgi:nucleoside-diphosphate-sugar epimerase